MPTKREYVRDTAGKFSSGGLASQAHGLTRRLQALRDAHQASGNTQKLGQTIRVIHKSRVRARRRTK